MTTPLRSHHLSAILPVTPQIYTWTAADFLDLLRQSVQVVGLRLVNETAFTFQPQGVSVVVLLAESHVALHFWPEMGKATVDIHVCDVHQDNRVKAQQLAAIVSLALSDDPQAVWHTFSISG